MPTKADSYISKVLDFLTHVKGEKMSRIAIARELSLDYTTIHGTLAKLHRCGVVKREGSGRRGDGFKYWLSV